MKLPRAVFVIVGNMQDGLPKPQDLCSGEDGGILRVCERPIVFHGSIFHETCDVSERSAPRWRPAADSRIARRLRRTAIRCSDSALVDRQRIILSGGKCLVCSFKCFTRHPEIVADHLLSLRPVNQNPIVLFDTEEAGELRPEDKAI